MSNNFEARCAELIAGVQNPQRRMELSEAIDSVRAAGAKRYGDLIDMLQNRRLDDALRMDVCLVLRRWNNKRASGALLGVLTNAHNNPNLRVEAGVALAGLGVQSATRTLANLLLTDHDLEIRKVAALALGWNRDRRAVKPLLKVLSNPYKVDEIRGYAAEALGRIGDHSVVPTLLETLQEASVVLRSDVIFALGEIGNARAISALEHIAATDERLTPDNTTLAEEARSAILKIMKSQQNAS